MKNKFFRILSVLLALTITFSSFAVFENPAFAADFVENADIPYIHVVGLMSSDIYEDPSDPDSPTVWPPETGKIVKAVLKIIPAAFSLAITKNYDKFADKLIPALNSVLDPTFLGCDGELTNKSGIRFEYPAREEIKKDSKLCFEYDWRIDPMIAARQLSDFIDYVLECSGSEQVVIECHSYGGVLTYTYAGIYGTDKVRSFLFNGSAVFGETFTGDLCRGELVLDPDALTEYLKGAFIESSAKDFLNGLFAFLNKTNITDGICNLVNKIVSKTHDRLYAETILPMFARWPSIWSMVTEEQYDASIDYIFNGFWKNDGNDYSGLYKKIDDFDRLIRKNRNDILNNINDTSNLYVVCRHGFCSMFCTPSWRVANDMIVDVKSASFGAEAAPYGEKFDSTFLAEKDRKYISPGENIDASTCMFPNQTWFIEDFVHMKNREAGDEMFEKLLYSEGQATVNTFEEYPAFLRFDFSDMKIYPAK